MTAASTLGVVQLQEDKNIILDMKVPICEKQFYVQKCV